ncbi:MAG: ribosome recycling factor [Candidatus Brennerbacteria bacterium]
MEILNEFKSMLAKLLEEVKAGVSSVRTNRPHSGLVEEIKVNHYGGIFPIKQLGSVGVTPPREIHIEAWDASAVPAIAKAIEASPLGLTANVEGNVLRIFLPALSDERRKELTKYVGTIAEEHRIKVRHVRDDANKNVQKALDADELTEDQKFRLKEDIQKATDEWNKNVEKLVETKIAEISN